MMDHGKDASVRVAVLIPCLNEATTISKVVSDFRRELPKAEIYVYDNNSSDDTAAQAASAGALVRGVAKRGKSAVVMRMFADIDADIYVLVDGDDTYEVSAIGQMIDIFVRGSYDMLVGRRVAASDKAYRAGHKFGNYFLNKVVTLLFGGRFDDMLSGFRVFNRKFVKSFPVQSVGFGIETELNVHSLVLDLSVIEFPVSYRNRPCGSFSKLRTYKDGIRILRTIFRLFIFERPVIFYGSIGLISFLVGLFLLVPIVAHYIDAGVVPRFPTAIASGFLFIFSFMSLSAGLILDHMRRLRSEIKLLRYLQG